MAEPTRVPEKYIERQGLSRADVEKLPKEQLERCWRDASGRAERPYYILRKEYFDAYMGTCAAVDLLVKRLPLPPGVRLDDLDGQVTRVGHFGDFIVSFYFHPKALAEDLAKLRGDAEVIAG